MDIIYSQFSSASVLSLVCANYPDLTPTRCVFYARGLHDNYLIESQSERFIFRIYRGDWRSWEDIQFELDLLDFLRKKNASVSSPIFNSEGKLSTRIDYPEGTRTAAIFGFADGQLPGKDNLTKTCEQLGRAVATMHLEATDFTTRYTRPVLDLPYLLDDSIVKITPFLDSAQMHYIEKLQKKIHAQIPIIPHKNGAFGACSGDINMRNFHINEKSDITLFDFDQCGYGLRAFEIGKFQSARYSVSDKLQQTNAFLNAYQQVRPLSEAELKAIPYFEIISIIWILTIYIDNADRIGHILMNTDFWKQRMDILKDLEANLSN